MLYFFVFRGFMNLFDYIYMLLLEFSGIIELFF